MKDEERNIILHAVKSIALSQRREATHRSFVIDDMCRDLGITIPNRRENGERRNGTIDTE